MTVNGIYSAHMCLQLGSLNIYIGSQDNKVIQKNDRVDRVAVLVADPPRWNLTTLHSRLVPHKSNITPHLPKILNNLWQNTKMTQHHKSYAPLKFLLGPIKKEEEEKTAEECGAAPNQSYTTTNILAVAH